MGGILRNALRQSYNHSCGIGVLNPKFELKSHDQFLHMAPPSKIMMIRSLARSFANFSHADGKVKTIWKNFDKTLDRGKKKNFLIPGEKIFVWQEQH